MDEDRIKALAFIALNKVKKTGHGSEPEQVKQMSTLQMSKKALRTLSLSQNLGQHFSKTSPEGIAVKALQHASGDDSGEAITDLTMGEFHKS